MPTSTFIVPAETFILPAKIFVDILDFSKKLTKITSNTVQKSLFWGYPHLDMGSTLGVLYWYKVSRVETFAISRIFFVDRES